MCIRIRQCLKNKYRACMALDNKRCALQKTNQYVFRRKVTSYTADDSTITAQVWKEQWNINPGRRGTIADNLVKPVEEICQKSPFSYDRQEQMKSQNGFLPILTQVGFTFTRDLLDPYPLGSSIFTRLESLSKVYSFGSVPT